MRAVRRLSFSNRAKNISTFIDDFSGNLSNWLIKDDAEISLQVEKSGYIIEHRQDSGWWATWKSFVTQPNSDLGIQAKIQRILGASNSFYGLIWNLANINNFNYLLINPNNQFIIGRYIDDEWHNLIAWTTAPFNSEVGSVNEIALIILKGNLELHVNGFHVLKHKWNNLISGNSIGFIVGHTMKVKITSLTITTENSVQLPKSKPISLPTIKRTHVDSPT